MSREEAISCIKQIRFRGYLRGANPFYEQDTEAMDMAIKALSQVSEIEENIIKYMKKYPNHVGNTDFWEGFYACRNVVLQLDDEEYAPKEQEQKSGKWIEDAKTYYEELNKRGLGVDEYTPYFTDDIACSECLAKYNTIDNETQFFKHCPNCGARMESEE